MTGTGDKCSVRLDRPGVLSLVENELHLTPTAVGRSELLSNALTLADDGDPLVLPISKERFLCWHTLISSHQCEEGDLSRRELVDVLKAADALGDGQTIKEVCQAQRPSILRALGLSGENNFTGNIFIAGMDRPHSVKCIAEVLTSLPSDVAVALLRAAIAPDIPAPLHNPPPYTIIPPALLSLPRDLHPIAFRSCSPGLDTQQCLSIELPDLPSIAGLAATLRRLTTLTSLHLKSTYADVAPSLYARLFASACRLPLLSTLHIADESVTDAHVVALANVLADATNLDTVALSIMPRTAGPVEALVAALSHLPRLRCIDVCDSLRVTDALLLGSAQRSMATLEELRVQMPRLSISGSPHTMALAKLLPRVRVLELSFVSAEVCGNVDVDAEPLVQEVCSLTTLEELSISDHDCPESRLAAALATHIGRCRHLTRLDLSHSVSFGESADVVALLLKLPQLRSLTIWQSPGAGSVESGQLAAVLSCMTALTLLDVTGCSLSMAGGLQISEAMPRLTALRVLHIGDITATVSSSETSELEAIMVKGIAVLSTLQELNLQNNCISPAGLGALLPPLRAMTALLIPGVMLGEHGVQLVTPCLLELLDLRVLDLSRACIDPASMRALAPVIRGLPELRELVLSQNPLGREGLQELARALEVQTSCGAGCVAGGCACGCPGVRLQLLDLSQISVGPEGINALLPALLPLTGLRELNLRQEELAVSDFAVRMLRDANPHLHVVR